MQVESLDASSHSERVKVRADFSGGSIRPLMFRTSGRAASGPSDVARHRGPSCSGSGGRVLRIERVNTSWTEREGSSSRVCFSVQAEGATYFLSLVLPDMIWRAEKVVLEG